MSFIFTHIPGMGLRFLFLPPPSHFPAFNHSSLVESLQPINQCLKCKARPVLPPAGDLPELQQSAFSRRNPRFGITSIPDLGFLLFKEGLSLL